MNIVNVFPDVKRLISSLEISTTSKIVTLFNLLEIYGNNLGMPYSKMVYRNLFELRIRGKQEVRIFYCFHSNSAYILHAFIKKSQKTPPRELKTAISRLKSL